MGTGYTRNDTANNIADGNVINAADLDGEFDAIESAFNSSTGHTHDGTSAEGAPIEVVGPTQDVVITASALRPKTDNTVDLGTSSLMYKDGFFDGTVTMHSLVVLDDEATDATIKLDGNYPDGTANVAMGLTALDSLDDSSPGGNNIAIGNAALTALTTGSHNIAIGSSAGDALTTGGKNIAIGFEALSTEDGNGESTAIGYQALKTQNAGASGLNVAVGYLAGTAVSTGVKNTLLGAEAGDAINSGGSNVAVGYGALTATTTSSSNTAVGADALKTNITGASNVAVGNTALEVATGSNNTAIGKDAGNLITTGAANTIIGQFDGNQGTLETLDIRTSDNHIVLSDGAGEPRIVVDDSGKVLIKNTSSVQVGGGEHVFQVGNADAYQFSAVRYNNGTGGSRITLGHTRSATVGTVGTAVVNNDNLGQIDFAGDDGADLVTVGARIKVEVDGTPSSDNMPSALSFLTFEDGGSLTERMRITNTGKVNIGLNDPTLDDELLSVLNDILIVTQSGSPNNTAGGSIHLGASGTSGTTHQVEIKSHRGVDQNTGELSFSVGDGSSITEAMRIDSSGRVLIGTSSSRSSSGGERQLQIEGTTGSTSSMSVTRNQNSANPAQIALTKTRGTSVGDNTIVQDNDIVGRIMFAAADGTDANSITAQIQAEIDGTPGSNDMPGRLVFSTTPSGAVTATERMRIDSSGNVGIGATTVNRKLEIAGNNNGGAKANYIRITDTDTSATAGNQQGGIEFYTSDIGNENVTASIENLYSGSGGGSELTFNTAPNGTSGVSERMRVDNGGNVGIGTDSPSSTLHVTALKNSSDLVYFNNTGSTASDTLRLNTGGGGSGTNILDVQSQDTTRFLVRGDGKVAIGHDSPEADLHILATNAGSSNPHLQIETTDAGTAGGPEISLYRNSASPVANDGLGIIRFYGEDGAGGKTLYGYINNTIVDPANGAESAKTTIAVVKDGVMRSLIMAHADEVVINDGSQDIDFRVESDNDNAAFFVSGSDGNVGMSVTAPDTHIPASYNTGKRSFVNFAGGGTQFVVGRADTAVSVGDYVGGYLFKTNDNSISKFGGMIATCDDGTGNANLEFYPVSNAYENASEGSMQLDDTGDLYVRTGSVRVGRSHGNVYANLEEQLIAHYASDTFTRIIARAPGSGGDDIFKHQDSGTVKSEIESNGDFLSATNSYGSTSDERLKENIEASGSQWDDIKALQVKKYSMIEDELDAPNKLGVIAQDLISSGMNGLVKQHFKTQENPETGEDEPVLDADGNQEEFYSVKYSILYMKAVKALQEAMERIETLETEQTAIKARLDALET